MIYPRGIQCINKQERWFKGSVAKMVGWKGYFLWLGLNGCSLPIQVATLFARNYPAQRAVVLPFGFASSLRRETRLQDWTHRYALSYRDLEEMMAERGVEVDHSTINRWVLKYAPELDKRIRPHLKPTNDSWRVDETYIKIKGVWKYLYRAVDSKGNTRSLHVERQARWQDSRTVLS